MLRAIDRLHDLNTLTLFRSFFPHRRLLPVSIIFQTTSYIACVHPVKANDNSVKYDCYEIQLCRVNISKLVIPVIFELAHGEKNFAVVAKLSLLCEQEFIYFNIIASNLQVLSILSTILNPGVYKSFHLFTYSN